MSTKVKIAVPPAINLEMCAEERARIAGSLPAPPLVLRELFDYLDRKLSEHDCEDNLRFAHEFVVARELPVRPMLAWLEEHGGYCDCEALSNVEEIVSDVVPGYELLRSDQPLG